MNAIHRMLRGNMSTAEFCRVQRASERRDTEAERERIAPPAPPRPHPDRHPDAYHLTTAEGEE